MNQTGLNIISGGSGVAAGAGPIGVEKFAARLVGALISVGAEVIALCLQQVGGQTRAGVAVEEGNRRGHARHGNAGFNRFGHHFAPGRQAVLQKSAEIIVATEKHQIGVCVVSIADIA